MDYYGVWYKIISYALREIIRRNKKALISKASC